MQTVTDADVSLTYVRPESPQLFFLFSGVWDPLTIHALEFMRASGIGDRNIVLIKDPYPGHCYRRGLSVEYPSLDGIVAWQRQLLATTFPHAREVFCLGASAGGGAALFTACRLGARAAWVLGGRIVRPEAVEERECVSREVYTRLLGRPTLDMPTPEERARLVEAFRDPELQRRRWDVTGNPDRLIDGAAVEQLVEVARACPAGTDLHLHYATTNVIDRRFADAFCDCRAVTLHPIEPPPEAPDDITFRDPDHGVMLILHRMGRLQELFAPYLGSAPSPRDGLRLER